MPLIRHSLDTARERVELHWRLPCSPPRVWWGLTAAEATPQWIGTVTSGEFTVGSVLTIQHAEDYSCMSTILACEPETLLAMTWKFPDEPTSHLRIELTPDEDSTRLTLTHDGLGAETASYLPGWQAHLLYLEGALLDRPLPMADFWATYEGLSSTER